MAKKKTTSAMDYTSGPFAAPKTPTTPKAPTTPKTPTAPKATTYTPVVQPSRTTDNIKADIASVVGSGNIDYNKLTSLAGELGGGKETADYIDNLISGQSTQSSADSLISGQSTKSNVDREYAYNVPFESAPPPTNEVYYAVPTFDPQQYIRGLMEAQSRQQIAALIEAQSQQQIATLDKAKGNSLTNLADEEAGIDPMYYDERNRVGAQKDVGDLNFAQYMASRGVQGSAGGANQMYSNSAFQGQIGALDRQEQAARDRIARNRTGVENAYQSDVAAARAGAEAQGLQAAIDQMNADKLFSLQEASVTGQYQGRPTMQGQQSQAEQLQQQASLLAAQYYDNIAGYINTLDPNDPIIPYLHVKRREKINTEAEKAAFAAAAQSEAEQQAWNNAFKLFQEAGRITSLEQAQILGLPQNATVADVDIARINAATSQMNAQTARKNAEKVATATTSTNSLDSYVNYIKANFGTNKSQISAYLESLMTAGVDDAIVNALAEKYGL